MRDMAKVVTLDHIIPMYGKDRIACAVFKETSYEMIIPKENAIPGSLYAFIEADSLLPVIPAWEFLRKRCFSEKLQKFLIKPMKMGEKNFNGQKGEPVRSWGLAVPINELPLDKSVISKLKAGTDLTELLGIEKYEPLEDASPKKGESKMAYPKWVKFCLSHGITRWIGNIWKNNHQNISGGFPTDIISKSDETTLQNMPWILERFKDSMVYVSPKWEGQSCTIVPILSKDKKKIISVYPCSRNNAYVKKCNNDFWRTMQYYDVENKIKAYFKETGIALVLQCEQIGPGIQDNIYCLPHLEWRVYTIKDAVTGKQLDPYAMNNICSQLDIPFVGCIYVGKLSSICPDVDTAVKYAEDKYWKPLLLQPNDKAPLIDTDYYPTKGEKLWKDYFQWEGVVIRTVDYDKDNNIGVSFKIKNLPYAEHGLGKIHNDVTKFLSVKL